MRKVMMTLVVLTVVAAAVFSAFYFSTGRLRQFGGKPSGNRLERVLQSPNYNGNEFVNQYGVTLSFTFSEYVTMFREFFFGKDRSPKIEIPVNRLKREDFECAEDGDFIFTWLGHSTVLLEIDGLRVLTDPVWSDKVSPSSLYGPIRFHEMPVAMEDLPRLDAVIISHDHYDHLDMEAVVQLAQTGTIFVTALGIGAHLEEWMIDPSQIVELDWWEEYSLGEQFKLICTPAQHFSGRGALGSTNKTLWSTWAIVGPKHRVFFSGDTGEIPEFKQIGEKFGPFDLTLMKIGAYSDMWPDIHLTPEQSVRLHQELDGRVFMPIHWGTFDLALHDWDEPINDLVKVAQQKDVTLVTPYPGQRIKIDSLPPVNHWWLSRETN
ncbi:MAG: MBL fold metallo-hydrolase [Candidatus Zixiibacteriota bacterium]